MKERFTLEKEIQLLRDMTEPAIQTIIENYTQWYFASAVTWVVCGLILFVLFYKLFIWWTKIEDKEDASAVFGFIGLVLLFLFSTLITLSNIPDLFSPKAAAIHGLLKDVRGK